MKKILIIILIVIASFISATSLAAREIQTADLVVLGNLNPIVRTEGFPSNSCAVQEGLISAGSHKIVRFSTLTANIGLADLKVGKPNNDTNLWEYFTCHGHWHFKQFADYRLTDLSGNVVGVGHKQSFCIEDTIHVETFGYRNAHYTCRNQGIGSGWADEYDYLLDGQWIVIDNVPPGEYILSVTVNPAQILLESNYSNNTTSVHVTIP